MGDGFHDILILLAFFVEVAVLFYLEMKAWKTLYTPLNFLMLPYVVILLLTVIVSGRFGFVEFYYPSVLLWSVGLLIFAVPSYVLAFVFQRNKRSFQADTTEVEFPKVAFYISIPVILLFLWRLKSMLGGPYLIGSDEFGEEFCGGGLWGHLRQLLLPILAMAVFFVDKKHKWLWLIIIPIIVITLLYQVKGWVIIPCLTGLILRLYYGRTKLKLSFMLYLVLGVFLFFLLSYILVLVVAGESILNGQFVSAIFGHFLHYLTSGTLGLSMDMQNGFPDVGEFDIVIAQLVNIGNLFVGDDMIVPLNPLYYNTGYSITNVRTLFGTVFINSGYWVSIVYFLFLSTAMYFLRLATVRFNNIFVVAIYFFECSLLFMGWFDTYFALLQVIEIPAILIVLLFVDRACCNKSVKSNHYD